MERDELIAILIDCLNQFYVNDGELLDNNTHEDALNNRLALYLREAFENEIIKVDTEYDRHINELKFYGIEGRRAIVDIVVHQRFTDENNILAFECKKRQPNQNDINKMEALIGLEYGYQLGIIVQYIQKQITVFEYIDGEIIQEIRDI